LGQSQESTQP